MTGWNRKRLISLGRQNTLCVQNLLKNATWHDNWINTHGVVYPEKNLFIQFDFLWQYASYSNLYGLIIGKRSNKGTDILSIEIFYR